MQFDPGLFSLYLIQEFLDEIKNSVECEVASTWQFHRCLNSGERKLSSRSDMYRQCLYISEYQNLKTVSFHTLAERKIDWKKTWLTKFSHLHR